MRVGWVWSLVKLGERLDGLRVWWWDEMRAMILETMKDSSLV